MRALPMLLLCPEMTPHEYKTRVVQVTTFTIILFVLAYAALVAGYALRFDKEAQHTSRLSGEHWVQELLDGHEDRIYNELGMHKHVFNRLLAVLGRDAGLHGTRRVSAKEQLAIFLHYVHRGLSNRALQERFQRSADTISKYVSLHLLIVIRTNAYLDLYIQFSMRSLQKTSTVHMYSFPQMIPPSQNQYWAHGLGGTSSRTLVDVLVLWMALIFRSSPPNHYALLTETGRVR